MGLEAASWINQLDSANPLGTDQKGQGDDHLRLIKSVLLATLPNFGGAVTASHTTINNTVATVAALPVLVSGEGTPTVTNNSNFTTTGTPGHKYIRVGNVVIVLLQFYGTCGASAAEAGTSAQITLPIASNLGIALDLFGIGVADSTNNNAMVPAKCLAITGNDKVQVNFKAPEVSQSCAVTVGYIYRVI